MATSTPVLLSFDSKTELQNIIEEAKAGLFSEAEDANMLANNILYLYNNQDKISRMGENARKLVEEKFSRRVCTGEWMKTLCQVMRK